MVYGSNRRESVVKQPKRIRDDVFVYMEGGGDSHDLRKKLTAAMSDWLNAWPALRNKRPRVVPCGGRGQAFDMYKTALAKGQNALLLVDSEELLDPSHQPPPAGRWLPWSHLKQQANWSCPNTARQEDAHLMVPCMEAWFLTQPEVLEAFFRKGFHAQHLPKGPVEAQPKQNIYDALKRASEDSDKGLYGKGAHSFTLLGQLDPAKVAAASPWAKRFLDELVKRKS